MNFKLKKSGLLIITFIGSFINCSSIAKTILSPLRRAQLKLSELAQDNTKRFDKKVLNQLRRTLKQMIRKGEDVTREDVQKANNLLARLMESVKDR